MYIYIGALRGCTDGGGGVAVLVCDVVGEDDAEGGGEDVFWFGGGVWEVDFVGEHFGNCRGFVGLVKSLGEGGGRFSLMLAG